MEAEVVWDAKTQSITLSKNGIVNTLFINKKTANKQDSGQTQTITLDVPPKVVNNTTFVPLRYISESFDINVGWNQATQTAYIGEYDVPGTGEYAGYNKLLNHQFEKDYDVYFKVEQNGNIDSMDIKKIKLKMPDMSQYITYTYLDGTSHTLTRGQWFEYFNILSKSDITHNIIRRKYGELYNEWVLNYSDTEVDAITEKYVDKKYFNIEPSNRYDLADAKFVFEWYNGGSLESEGIIVDYSNFNARFDPNSWMLLVSGSIVLKDKNNNSTIQELTFNDSLPETKDGNSIYYAINKNNINIRLKAGDGMTASYKAEFNGADLLKLGIIK
jgi:archaellin